MSRLRPASGTGLLVRSRRPFSTEPVHDVGRWYGVLFVALALVAKVDVRARDPELALQGAADAQVLVEVACWALAGCWALLRLLRDRAWLRDRFPWGLGPALQWYLAVGVLCAVMVAVSASPLTTVRAGQLLVLLALAVLVQRDIGSGRVRLLDVWTAASRTLVVAALSLVLTGVLFPELTSVTATWNGYERYRLLQMHPIGSGQVLGLAVLLAAADLVVRLRRMSAAEQSGLVAAVVVLGSALWATKARGVLLATVVALGVLVLVTPDARRRAQALLLAAVGSVPLVAGMLDGAVAATFVRGQTADQLLSLTGRTELFGYAWDLVAERPVTGHGYLAARGLFLERFPWAGESHNVLVDIAISLGVVGLGLYGWLLGTVVVSLWRASRRTASVSRRRGAAAGWALLTWLTLDGVAADSFGGPVGVSVLGLVLLVLLSDEVRFAGRAGATAARGPGVAGRA